MNLALWTLIWLPGYFLAIDAAALSDSTTTTTTTTTTTDQPTKNFGNRLRRARAHRERNTDKPKREISRQQRERQTATKAPFQDPSYNFAFRTPEYQRRENADSTGKVKGLYSFIDDVGEKHLVRYAASADRGFEVFNSVPDASRYVQFSAPLYKTSPAARGRIAYERGPGRQYKFISSGPDQRRSESTGPDGITRGAYSYLDDKGVQRTTQYIAGAGIGYRIVQDTTGPQTHLLPRPSLVEFGILYPPRQPTNRVDGNDDNDNAGGRGTASGSNSFEQRGSGGRDSNNNNGGIDNGDGNEDGENTIDNNNDPFGDAAGGGFEDFDDSNVRKSSRPGSNNDRSNSDFPKGGRVSTIITNSGDAYFGIAPGASARAHVQNIDLRPSGEQGAPSPAEALRRDERRDERRSQRWRVIN